MIGGQYRREILNSQTTQAFGADHRAYQPTLKIKPPVQNPMAPEMLPDYRDGIQKDRERSDT